MAKRKFEVHGTLGYDTVIVGCDDRATAETAAKDFKKQGYTNVRIVENA